MEITGFDHLTVNVSDLKASKAFYKEILGLEEAGFIDMGDHTLTYYRLPLGVRLELIEYSEKKIKKDLREDDIGIYRHFCLETDELEQFCSVCREHHVTVRKEPSYVDKLGCSTMLIVDPNGVEIEIIQR